MADASPERSEAERDLVAELHAAPYEPLLPIEKKLIAGSLIVGAVLLGILIWASTTYFPVSALNPTK